MRLRRDKAEQSRPVALPDRGEAVAISTATGGQIPSRVIGRDADSLLVAMLVPTRPFTPRELEGLVLLFNNPRGRIRLTGSFSIPDEREPDVLRLLAPRFVEVLQEREYVRINAARPVLVYRVGDQMEVPSYTVDVSGGGLLLAGPDSLKPGDEVHFRLTLQPGTPPVAGKGRVVRIDPQGRRAVAFEQITELDRRRLVRFIFECQRTERRRGLQNGEHRG